MAATQAIHFPYRIIYAKDYFQQNPEPLGPVGLARTPEEASEQALEGLVEARVLYGAVGYQIRDIADRAIDIGPPLDWKGNVLSRAA